MKVRSAGRQLPPETLAALCLQLQALSDAGIAPEEGFSILSEDAQEETERLFYSTVTGALADGCTLTEALEACGGLAPAYFIGMVRVGERTGTLETVFGALAVYFDRAARLRDSIRSAVVFPLLMGVLMIALIAVLLLFVLPVFRSAFAAAGQALPMADTLLTAGRWTAIAAATLFALAVVAGIVLWHDARTGRLGLLRRTRIFRKTAAGRFASAMALMLHSGLPLEEALRRAGELAGCDVAAEAAEQLDEGASLSDALRATGLFSGYSLRLLRVGERTGHAEQMMEEVAARMNEQAAAALDESVARIEPAVVAVLAVCAGLVLLSILLPLLGAAAVG